MLFDTWRRMELVLQARRHVQRKGFAGDVDTVCNAHPDNFLEAWKHVGDKGIIRDVLRHREVESGLKRALTNLMLMSDNVVGTDAARAKARHEQNGLTLWFGEIQFFVTPNLADVRHPLMVKLHLGPSGDLPPGHENDDPLPSEFAIDLLAEEPTMPLAQQMLAIVAANPVAQA